jgi:hypothetical protein
MQRTHIVISQGTGTIWTTSEERLCDFGDMTPQPHTLVGGAQTTLTRHGNGQRPRGSTIVETAQVRPGDCGFEARGACFVKLIDL